MLKRMFGIALIGVGLSVHGPAMAASYDLQDLGVGVTPTAINAAGQVVGSRVDAPYSTVAVVIAPDGSMQDIAAGRVANAINDDGLIVGSTASGSFVRAADGQIVLWDGYGAYGVNNPGVVSGNVARPNPFRPTPLPLAPALLSDTGWDYLDVAFVYPRGTRDGIYADLFVLNDINDAGFAVGRKSRYGLYGTSSFMTTPAFDGVTYLPIPYGGYAAAINNLNNIVGVTGSNSSTGEHAHAYLYNDTQLVDLGTLHGGLTSAAYDINNLDQVVGTSWLETAPTSVYDPTKYHAFLWENGQLTDLNDVVPAGSDWLLTSAATINDRGDIAGTGLRGDVAHGFVLRVSDGPADADGDGVQDSLDNCILAANADQRDSNGDGFGNVCDPDLDDNGTVNFADLSLFRLVFLTDDAAADFNGDGIVNLGDLVVIRAYFFGPPGPSGLVP